MTGRDLSPKQPGWEDWPRHPISKAMAGVGSTSYLHSLPRARRSLSLLLLSPRTQEPREFLQLEQGGEKGRKRVSRVFYTRDLRDAHTETRDLEKVRGSVSHTRRTGREKRKRDTGEK